MVRIKRADGSWDEAGKAAHQPFQRADGSIMTQDEVATIATRPTAKELNDASARQALAARRAIEAAERAARQKAPAAHSFERVSDADLDAAWQAFLEAPTRATAAAAVGLGEKTLDGRLYLYMRRHGLEGKPTDHRRAHVLGRAPGTHTPAEYPESSLPSTEKPPIVGSVQQPIPEAPRMVPDDPARFHRERRDPAAPRPAVPVPASPALERAIAAGEVRLGDASRAAARRANDWQDDARRRYLDLLFEKAQALPDDSALFDRIERLLGLAAA